MPADRQNVVREILSKLDSMRGAPALQQLMRSAAVDVCIRAYEARKLEWIEAHPEANHVEYQAAMTRIAQECGV